MTWMMRPAWMASEIISKPMQISAKAKRGWPRVSSSIPFQASSQLARRRQSEGDHIVTARRIQLSMSTGRNDQELPLVTSGPISHRGGLAARRQPIFPQFPPGLDVESAKIAVHGGSDKDQVTGGSNGPTHIRHPEIPGRREPGTDALRGAQRNLPDYTITAQVDTDQ